VVMLGAALSAGTVALYLGLGSPGLADLPLTARGAESVAAGEASGQDLAAAVAHLRETMASHPEDAQGWLLLARSEGALGHWPEASEAFRRARALTGDAPEAAAGYAEMLVKAADGVVTPEAQTAFRSALAKDPGNLSARFYLALADAQAGRAQAALAAWGGLAAEAPEGAGWLPMLRRQMAKTAREAGLPMPAAASAAPGPSAADQAAAARLDPAARQQMIRGMVESLAARLRDNPNDLAGWERLANAYRVLGEEQKAQEAAAHIAALDPGGVAPLLAEAHALLVNGGGRDPTKKLPDRLVELMKEIERRDPKQPEALWYLGLAAAQDHNPSAAAEYWQRLLALLDPGSAEYKTVQEAVAAIARKN
jgi:cytochrome c-type biogenesis protein CcmH